MLEGIEKKLIQYELKFDQMMERIELKVPKETGIFFNDQIFDAYVFSSELIKSAKRSVVLIDNYMDEVTILQLSKCELGVDGTVYTETVNSTL